MRLFDYEGKKDCLTVCADLVRDHKFFFRMMQLASNERAFQQDC